MHGLGCPLEHLAGEDACAGGGCRCCSRLFLDNRRHPQPQLSDALRLLRLSLFYNGLAKLRLKGAKRVRFPITINSDNTAT